MPRWIVLALASLFTHALAQSSAPVMNYLPSTITAEIPFPLVTKSQPANLTDASIYTWNTERSLSNGNDYAIMITQNNEFKLSSSFAISGGIDSQTSGLLPASTSTSISISASVTESIPASTFTIASNPSSPPGANGDPDSQNTTTGGVSGQIASPIPYVGSPTVNDTANALLHQGPTALGKGGLIAVIVGAIGILSALSTLLVFFVATTALGKKAALASADDVEETTALAQPRDESEAPHSRSVTPIAHCYGHTGMQHGTNGSIGPGGSDYLSSSSSSPHNYHSSTSSPRNHQPHVNSPHNHQSHLKNSHNHQSYMKNLHNHQSYTFSPPKHNSSIYSSYNQQSLMNAQPIHQPSMNSPHMLYSAPTQHPVDVYANPAAFYPTAMPAGIINLNRPWQDQGNTMPTDFARAYYQQGQAYPYPNLQPGTPIRPCTGETMMNSSINPNFTAGNNRARVTNMSFLSGQTTDARMSVRPLSIPHFAKDRVNLHDLNIPR